MLSSEVQRRALVQAFSSVNVCASLDEESSDLKLAMTCRMMQGSPVMKREFIDIGIRLIEQEHDDVFVTGPSRSS